MWRKGSIFPQQSRLPAQHTLPMSPEVQINSGRQYHQYWLSQPQQLHRGRECKPCSPRDGGDPWVQEVAVDNTPLGPRYEVPLLASATSQLVVDDTGRRAGASLQLAPATQGSQQGEQHEVQGAPTAQEPMRAPALVPQGYEHTRVARCAGQQQLQPASSTTYYTPR